jgi:YD repeat-containing protein
MHRRSLLRRNLLRVLIVVLLIVVVNLYRPHLNRYLPLLGVLRFSSIVTEAVNLANEHQGAVELLGSPIELGWFVRGYIGEVELYSGESELFIPVSGPKNKGTLLTRAKKRDGSWIFTEAKVSTNDHNSVNLFESPSDQSPRKLEISRRVYIVPLGSVPEVGLSELPQYYREKFNLSVELLDPIPLEESVYDRAEGKVVDDELEELLKRRIPRIANDPAAVLIGITAEDMYIRGKGTSSMYNRYSIRGRFGFVSTFLLTRRRFEAPNRDELLRARVRKLISRDIGISAYRLPMSDDPTSVLSDSIGWVGNIDLLSESFEGLGPRAVVDEYRVAKNEPSYEPKLLSTYREVEPKRVDGRYPCLLMKRQHNNGTGRARFDVTVDKCLPKSLIDSEVDEIEVNLRSGLIITKTTDLFVPGLQPMAATRCYRSWDLYSRTFGRNTTLSWDMYPVGDKHPHTYMDLYLCGGSEIHYERISQGSGFADVLYEHRQTATSFFGSRIRWNGNAWDLKLADGTEMFFPGTYKGGRSNDGALIVFRGAKGGSITIERDRRRNLKRLIEPNQKSITFEYDSRNRVVRAVDDQKQVVKYAYDVVGRLVEVQRAGLTNRFDYDYEDIRAIFENGQRLVQFQYSSGLVEQISLLDGRQYKIRYDYDSEAKSKILRTYLTLPNGMVHKFEINPE